jgi:hypothetical protein
LARQHLLRRPELAKPIHDHASRTTVTNKARGTASSASWKTTYRPWRTIRAPTLLNFPDLHEDERHHFLRLLAEENNRLTRVVEHLLGDPRLRQALL